MTAAAIPAGTRTRRRGVVGPLTRGPKIAPRRFGRAAVSGTIGAACGIGLLATSGWLITRAAGRPPVFVLSVAIGLVQAFALGRGLARYAERLGVHDVSLDVLGRLRLELFDTLEPLVPGGLGPNGSGAVLSAFVSDAEIMATAFAKRVTAAIDVTASVVLGAAVAAAVEPSVGAVLAAGAVVMVVAALALARLGRAGAEREAAARAELAGSVLDTMRVARELVAYGREDLVDSRLEEIRRRSNAGAARRALATGIGRAVATFGAAAALIAVVATGIAAHDAGHLTGVMLAVEAFVALAVYDQCASLPPVLADVGAARAAARRLRDLGALDAPVREPDVDESPPGRRLAVAFDDVAVVHADKVALDGLSLRLDPGRRIGLVGRSGSGKTSALWALLHFVPCARGTVSVGGVGVDRMSRQGTRPPRRVDGRDDPRLRREPRRQPAPRRPGRRRRGARRGAPARRARDLVRLPAGPPRHRARRGGRPMSAGERQRLGLARTLLAGGDVLALDEPTAHIDPASSADVLAELVGAAGSRAVLVVSHEPDLGRLVDEIVTLDAGRVVTPVAGE